MYAVIFTARVAEFDDAYHATAEKLHELAFNRYGCRKFTACTEGRNEIAISYWDDEAQILAWKQDVDHMAAQEMGRAKWYECYSVEVVKVVRQYKHESSAPE